MVLFTNFTIIITVVIWKRASAPEIQCLVVRKALGSIVDRLMLSYDRNKLFDLIDNGFVVYDTPKLFQQLVVKAG